MLNHSVDAAPQLKCCGVNNSTDWKNFGTDGNSVPDSCCITVAKGCGTAMMTDETVVYQKVILDMSSTLTQPSHERFGLTDCFGVLGLQQCRGSASEGEHPVGDRGCAGHCIPAGPFTPD